MSRYDSIVIGTGPAGLQAAIHLTIRKKKILLLGNKDLSRKINIAPSVNNYLGLPEVTGKEMATAFKEHLDSLDISITEEMVSTIYPMGDYYALATQHNTYEADTIILAPGVFTARTFPGEDDYLGKGVGYCATCDAPLYKDKTVAIVGYSNGAVQEANFMADVAKKVYYIPVGKLERTPDPRVEVVTDRVQEIKGDTLANTLVLKDQTLAVDGIFILRDNIAPTALLPGLALDGSYIKVNEAMETNLPGCFAAGDCTGQPHQYIRAAGQGLVAGFSAVDYLAAQDKAN